MGGGKKMNNLKNTMHRLMITVLSIALVLCTTNYSIEKVSALTEDEVTILVADSESNPISGAAISYQVSTDGVFDDEALMSGTTDENGLFTVVSTEEFDSEATYTVAISSIQAEYYAIQENLEHWEVSDTLQYSVVLEKLVIENVTVTPLVLGVYDGQIHPAFTVDGTLDGDTVLYKTEGSDVEVEGIPEITDFGTYKYTVIVRRAGYLDDFTAEVEASIGQATITDVVIVPTLNFDYDAVEHELISEITGVQDTDTVTYYLNSNEVAKDELVAKEPGTYTVQIVVDRGSNYVTYSNQFDVVVSTGTLDLSVSAEGVSTVYTGEEQALVVVTDETLDQPEYTIQYSVDGGATWTATVPTASEAGSYNVLVKAVPADSNYDEKTIEVVKADGASEGNNAYIAQADPEIAFENYIDGGTTELTMTDGVVNGTVASFVIKDFEATYSVALSDTDERDDVTIDDIATINENGVLTIKDSGIIVVTAEYAGDNNYLADSISHTVSISSSTQQYGKYISFAEDSFNYIFGENLPENKLSVNVRDRRYSISYSLSLTNVGLSISENGVVTISDYEELGEALAKNQGTLQVDVFATKSAGRFYGEDIDTYRLVISYLDTPDSPFEVSGTLGLENWYTTKIDLNALDGYQISNSFTDFADSVEYTEEGIFTDVVYLRHIADGGITAAIPVEGLKIDTVEPSSLNVSFSEGLATDGDVRKYYGSTVTVTVNGTDETSGIVSFDWVYTREDGVSESILETESGTLTTITDNADGTFTATLTLPVDELNQYRGSLSFEATDEAGNKTSVLFEDETVFVIDSIKPVRTVEHAAASSEINCVDAVNKFYYSGEAVFTFTITEINFVSDDVVIKVTKDGEEYANASVVWTDGTIVDTYVGTMSLTEDGDYVVTAEYTDRSGNVMESYISELISIDTIKPEMTSGHAGIDTDVVETIVGEQYYYNGDVQFEFVMNERYFEKDKLFCLLQKMENLILIQHCHGYLLQKITNITVL